MALFDDFPANRQAEPGSPGIGPGLAALGERVEDQLELPIGNSHPLIDYDQFGAALKDCLSEETSFALGTRFLFDRFTSFLQRSPATLRVSGIYLHTEEYRGYD